MIARRIPRSHRTASPVRSRARSRSLALAGSAVLAVLLTALGGSPAVAQISIGPHAVKANEFGGGSWGVGLNLDVEIPVVPLSARAAVERFFPDCGSGVDCSLWGASLDARFELVLPVVQPYVLGGLVNRRFDLDDGNGSQNETGVAVGLGVDFGLLTLGAFVEVRWEFVNAPDDQAVWRVGLSI